MTRWHRRRAEEDLLARSGVLFEQLRSVLAEADRIKIVAGLELGAVDEEKIESLLDVLGSVRAQLADLARLYTAAVELLDRQYDLWRDRYPKKKS